MGLLTSSAVLRRLEANPTHPTPADVTRGLMVATIEPVVAATVA